MVLSGFLRFASLRSASLRFGSPLSPAVLVASSVCPAPLRSLGSSFRLDRGCFPRKSSNQWVGILWGWVVGDSESIFGQALVLHFLIVSWVR